MQSTANGVDNTEDGNYNNNRGDINDGSKTSTRGNAGIPGQIISSTDKGMAQGISSLDRRKNYRGIGSSLIQKLKTKGATPVSIGYTSNATTFHTAIGKAKQNNSHGAFVTQHSVEEYAADALFLSEDKNVGVAITADGDIVSVFKNPDFKGKKAVSSILLTAIENGGNKLDNFHGGLSHMYWQHGFIPVARTSFNEEFAPSDWNYERDGKPDIIFWIHNGDNVETVADKIGDYGDLPDVSELPLFEYEEAAAYRDSFIERATSNTEAASFMPENSARGEAASDYFGDGSGDEFFGDDDTIFHNPDVKDIARAPEASERFEAISGKIKTNVQRHIVDIAKKLDSDLKVEFVKGLSVNGRFERKGNRLLINADLTTAQMYVEIFKHEFMHRLETKKLYKSFMEYCFNKSVAFENWARVSLGTLQEYQDTAFSMDGAAVIDALTQYYLEKYQKYEKGTSFAEGQSFSYADAQKELIADFFGEVLFKGKAYQKQIAAALENGELLPAGDIDSSVDALTELAQKERGLLQKIKDVINEIISAIKREWRNRGVVEDLEYLEKRLEQVYQSADSKKALRKAQGEVKNSIILPFTDNKGNRYENAVLLDTDFFDGLSPRNWGAKLREYVYERAENSPFIMNVADESGNIQQLQFAKLKDRVTKNGHSNHKVIDELSSGKDNISKLAVMHIDEIAEISEESNPYYTDENNHQWLDEKGWLHRKAYVIRNTDGAIFDLTLDIAKSRDGRVILYATKGKIKKVGNVQVNSLKLRGSGQNSNFDYSIPNSSEKVNKKNVFGYEVNSNSNDLSSGYSLSEANSIEKTLFDDAFYSQFGNEDKTTITQSIEELQEELNEIDKNYTDADFERRFSVNTKIKALKSGYQSEYDYFVGEAKKRKLEDYKNNPKKYERLFAEKIRETEKKKQLAKDIEEATPLKREQYYLIEKYNPAPEGSNYVWVRSPKDIKTFDEVINDKDSFVWGDYTKDDALRDLKRGKIVIYSSYPIKQGVFVSTSFEQAKEYAGGESSKVYSKEVPLTNVAWINGDEGQYAEIKGKFSHNKSGSNITVKFNDIDKSNAEDYNYDSHYGENLRNTPQYLKPSTDREWQVFCRSFANKTNGIKKGEYRSITIFTSDNQYLISADGYISGVIISKATIDDYNERIEFYGDDSGTDVSDYGNEKNGNRQGDNRYGSNPFENKGTDTFDMELDAFIESHPEWFADNRETYSDYKRRLEAERKVSAFSMPKNKKHSISVDENSGNDTEIGDIPTEMEALMRQYQNGEFGEDIFRERTDKANKDIILKIVIFFKNLFLAFRVPLFQFLKRSFLIY